MSINSIIPSNSKQSFIVSDEPVELEKIIESYHIVFQTPGVDLKDIDVFLFGEKHNSLECKKINGETISLVGGPNKIAVFIECISSWKSLESSKKFYQQNLCIDDACCVNFYGWDASVEVLNSMGLTIELKEVVLQQLHKIDRLIREVKLNLICREIKWLEYDSEERLLYLQLFQDGLAVLQKNLNLLLEERCRFQKMWDQGSLTDEKTRRAFPDRTQAMVKTLQQLRSNRKLEGKVFLIAGARHLVDCADRDGKEYTLEPLYEELFHHKAIILIPRIIC